MTAMYIFRPALVFIILVSWNYVSSQDVQSTCQPCAELKCVNGQNCTHVPLVKCPPLGVCRGKIVKDRCGCCDVCLTSIGHKCHEDVKKYKERVCEAGLKCVPSDESLLQFEVGIKKSQSCRCEKETVDCLDPVNKKKYKSGEIWTRGEFACEVCSCDKNGQLKCVSLRCDRVTCADSKRVENRCCAFCMKDDWDKGCEYDGETFFEGEVVIHQDGRSICHCKRRRWHCHSDNFHQSVYIAEKPECKDEVRDEPVKEFAIWLPSECAQCECGTMSRGKCSVINCRRPRCQEPFTIKGRCCPVCPEDFKTMCHFQGKKYFSGDKAVLPDRCTICTCENSGWKCSSEKCKGSKFIKEPFQI